MARVAGRRTVGSSAAGSSAGGRNAGGRRKSAAPAAEPTADQPFWRVRGLDALTPAEWESLCDGCGRCCLNKLQDEDTGVIEWTCVSCRLLDTETCRCTDYPHRRDAVPDCIQLTPETVRSLGWLPATCAYRLVAEGKDLADWHPLVSGSRETVHEAGVSMLGRVSASETDLAEPEDYFDHVLDGEP